MTKPPDDSDFIGFGEYDYKPPPYLPDTAHLHGYDTVEKRDVPLRVDGQRNLLLVVAPQVYVQKRPALIPITTPGILAAGSAAGRQYLVGIDVVNTTGAAVSLKLYYAPQDITPDDTFIFATCGEDVPANGLFTWRGCFMLETDGAFWGLAGAASALRAFLSIRQGRRYIR
jgi:hypothetical protein